MPKPCMLKNMFPSTLILVGATTMVIGSINLVPSDKYILAQGGMSHYSTSSSPQSSEYEAVVGTQAIVLDETQTLNEEYAVKQYIVSGQAQTYTEQLLPNIQNQTTAESSDNSSLIENIVETSTEQTTVSSPQTIEDAPNSEQEPAVSVQEDSREGYTSPLVATDTPLFPVTDEQRQLIEMASNMKDTTPFSPNMGPNTNNRYEEWMKSDRSIKNINSVRAYAFLQMGKYAWTVDEWVALDRLWWHESGWAPTRQDGDTTRAWGIPQALPASKMAKYGDDYLTNPYTQVLWGLDYINSRYGSPTKAWNFWLQQAQDGSPGWY